MAVLDVEIADGIAVLTLNRPEARNALNTELRQALDAQLRAVEADPEVAVIVLTGAGKAFCAGLDLKELGSGGNAGVNGGTAADRNSDPAAASRPFPPLTKPLIGAINGPAITGGFELALNCDFLVASTDARFADTHARVGVMPGWGLSVLLPAAIGFRRAREMSLTGNFLQADDAHSLGLVNHVVEPTELMATALRLAGDIAANQRDGVTQMLRTYDKAEADQLATAWSIESDEGRAFRRQAGFDPAEVEARRVAIVERGRSQIAPDQT